MVLKKRIITALIAMLAVVTLLGLVGCGKDKECDHKWGKWRTVEEATCTEGGLKERSCSKCGESETKKVSASGHSGSVVWESDENGHKQVYDCCGKVVSSREEHSYGEWETIVEGNCVTEGLKERTCSVCGYVDEETVVASGVHTGQEVWITTAQTHKKVYDCCYSVVEEESNHVWSGVTCTVCDYAPTVVAENVDAYAGSAEVAVKVSIRCNPSIIGLQMNVVYDESVLTLIGATNGTALSSLEFTKAGSMQSGAGFMWDGVNVNTNEVKDGEFLTLTFSVNEFAPIGKHSIVIANLKAYDVNGNEIELEVEHGSITVQLLA